jgi:hypothetical protein
MLRSVDPTFERKATQHDCIQHYPRWQRFGSSLGSSAWMIVASCFLLLNDQRLLATIPAIAFAMVLVASLILWARRDRIDPLPAMMFLLGVLTLTFPIVWITVHSYGSQTALAAMNWPESRWPSFLVCVTVPVLMLWFLVLDRKGAFRKGTTS